MRLESGKMAAGKKERQSLGFFFEVLELLAGGMMMAPAAPSLGDMVVGAAVQGAVGGAVSGA
eukprot:310587-Amphidinium_carterae.1